MPAANGVNGEGVAEQNGVNGEEAAEPNGVYGNGVTPKGELINGGLARRETSDVVPAMVNGHTAA